MPFVDDWYVKSNSQKFAINSIVELRMHIKRLTFCSAVHWQPLLHRLTGLFLYLVAYSKMVLGSTACSQYRAYTQFTVYTLHVFVAV